MKLWLDAQISPQIAVWIKDTFSIEAISVKSLGLTSASDEVIFQEAKKANAVVMTKDSDFCKLLDNYGVPPSIIWVTCGNTSNENLKRILLGTLLEAKVLIEGGEPLVEIQSE